MATRLPWRRVHPQDRYPPARREFTISRSPTSSSSRSRRRALTHRISSAAAGAAAGDLMSTRCVSPSSSRRAIGGWAAGPNTFAGTAWSTSGCPQRSPLIRAGEIYASAALGNHQSESPRLKLKAAPPLYRVRGLPRRVSNRGPGRSPTWPGLAISRVRISNASSSAAYGQKRCTGSASHLELSALLRHQHCHDLFPVHPKL